MRVLAGLAFLLILVSQVSAGFLDDLGLAFPVFAFISIMIIVAVKLLADTIQSSQLEAWFITELREFGAGLIVCVAVLGIFFVSNVAATPFVTVITGEANPPAAAMQFIDTLTESTTSFYTQLMRVYHYTGIRSGIYSSFTQPLWFLSTSISVSPFSGYGQFFMPLSYASNALSNALFGLFAVRSMLDFVRVVAPGLLSLALGLRVFPFTRSLGSTLIALLIGLYIIFPTSVLFVSAFHDSLGNEVPKSSFIDETQLKTELSLGAIDDFSQFICKSETARFFFNGGELIFGLPICLPLVFIPGAFGFCYTFLVPDFIYPGLVVLFNVAYSLSLAASGFFAEGVGNIGSYYSVTQAFLTELNNWVVLIYFYLVCISILTVVMVRSISGAFGGEAFIPAIQRLTG